MRRVEHLWIFHAQRREIVDVEEAAVVDLARAAPPESEPIVLRVEQRAQPARALLALRPSPTGEIPTSRIELA